jgi:hypothetical protein
VNESADDIRHVALALRQVYVALMAEGFTQQQSLVIIGQVLASTIKP